MNGKDRIVEMLPHFGFGIFKILKSPVKTFSGNELAECVHFSGLFGLLRNLWTTPIAGRPCVSQRSGASWRRFE